MTKLEAVKVLLGSYKIGARMVSSDYDPAGSTSEYVPDPRGLAVVEALVDRRVTEDDLYFNVGGGNGVYFSPARLISEIKVDA
jgi:hypothetical protein